MLSEWESTWARPWEFVHQGFDAADEGSVDLRLGGLVIHALQEVQDACQAVHIDEPWLQTYKEWIQLFVKDLSPSLNFRSYDRKKALTLKLSYHRCFHKFIYFIFLSTCNVFFESYHIIS